MIALTHTFYSLPRMARTAILTAILLSCLCSQGLGAYFKYIDDNGNPVFVDDKTKIPVQFRNDAEKHQGKYDHLSHDERQALYEKQRAEAEQDKALELAEEKLRKEQARLKEMTLPVTIRGNQVLVPVRIKQRGRSTTLRLILDTGATMTVLYRSRVERLNLRPGKKIRGTLAGGHISEGNVVELDQLEVGPFEYRDIRVFVLPDQGNTNGIDGLLGMDVLRNHPYQIDFDNNLLLWDHDR
ncbi:MAG: hypothetical protein C0616_01705 [Desulfuromonas sp.]|nr:MAG: hypothetical protein C0616_01705 [Desulfuromonas sp.]